MREPPSKKIIRKPIYRNLDLDKIYGNEPAPEYGEVDDDDLFRDEILFSRKKQQRGKMPPIGDSDKLRNLEKVYLQRLENRRKNPKHDRSDILSRGGISDAESIGRSPSEKVLSFVGDEIAYDRSKNLYHLPEDTPRSNYSHYW